MRQRVVGSMMALLVGMAPLAAMAQATSFDPATIASVQSLAKEVAYLVVPGMTAPEPQTGLLPTPEATSEPEDEIVALPELNLTDLAEYTNQGITIQSPADWIVDLGSGDGDAIFYIEIPGAQVFLSFEADSALDFPSLFGVSLFRSQAELLITEFADGAQVDETATLFTPQALPMAKLGFSGEADGEAIAGAFYVIAPSESAYLLVAGGTPEHWAQVAEGVQLIAESMTFDENLISLATAGDEPLLFSNEDESVQAEVPPGWYVVDTGDPIFPIIMAEPEVRFVVAVGAEDAFAEDANLEALQEYLPSSGEVDPAEYDELIQAIVDTMSESGSDMLLDADQSEVYAREGALTARLVGDADLGDGLSMPVVVYIDLRSDDIAMIGVFGDVETALGVEELIQAVVESVTMQ